MSYNMRRRKKFLKKFLFFCILFINPLCGMISALIMTYQIANHMPSGISAILYPTWPGYFQSSWALVLKKDTQSRINELLPWPDSEPVVIPLTLFHGPWLPPFDTSQENQWDQRFASWGQLKQKNSDHVIQNFNMLLKFFFNTSTSFDINEHKLRFVSNYAPFNQGHTLMFKGIAEDHDKTSHMFSKFSELDFYSSSDPSLLGLWLPSMALTVEDLSLSYGAIQIKQLQSNLHTQKYSHKSSLVFETSADSVLIKNHHFQYIVIRSSIINASAQILNKFLLQEQNNILQQLFLKVNFFEKPIELIKRADSLQAGLFNFVITGKLNNDFSLNITNSLDNQESIFHLQGASEDVIKLIEVLQLDLDDITLQAIESAEGNITLDWEENGWEMSSIH